jgi:prevent-host-death family protein
MQRIGTRELREHTEQVLSRVRNGEQILLVVRGTPVAMLSPIDAGQVEAASQGADARDVPEHLEWLRASEPSFESWDNEDDDVWDRVQGT